MLLLLLLQSRFTRRSAFEVSAFAAANDSESAQAALDASGGGVADPIGQETYEALYSSTDSAENSSSSSFSNSRLSGLPPVFVLNLDRSHERWKNTQDQLLRAGLEAQRLSAVDGRLLSRDDLLKVKVLRCDSL
jgi:hypothetical protein